MWAERVKSVLELPSKVDKAQESMGLAETSILDSNLRNQDLKKLEQLRKRHKRTASDRAFQKQGHRRSEQSRKALDQQNESTLETKLWSHAADVSQKRRSQAFYKNELDLQIKLRQRTGQEGAMTNTEKTMNAHGGMIPGLYYADSPLKNLSSSHLVR